MVGGIHGDTGITGDFRVGPAQGSGDLSTKSINRAALNNTGEINRNPTLQSLKTPDGNAGPLLRLASRLGER